MTSVVDKLVGLATGQPRLRHSVRGEERGPFFRGVTHGGRVGIVLPPESVVIRVQNMGRVPVEVESVGAQLR